jgi:hypothetical protein
MGDGPFKDHVSGTSVEQVVRDLAMKLDLKGWRKVFPEVAPKKEKVTYPVYLVRHFGNDDCWSDSPRLVGAKNPAQARKIRGRMRNILGPVKTVTLVKDLRATKIGELDVDLVELLLLKRAS